MDKNKTMYPLEHLIFQVEDEQYVDAFIDMDYEVWTMFLKNQSGFISKQIWVNDNNKGEVHAIITWESLKNWKAISKRKLSEINTVFNAKFPYKFEIVRKFYENTDYGLFEYGSYIKQKGEKLI